MATVGVPYGDRSVRKDRVGWEGGGFGALPPVDAAVARALGCDDDALTSSDAGALSQGESLSVSQSGEMKPLKRSVAFATKRAAALNPFPRSSSVDDDLRNIVKRTLKQEVSSQSRLASSLDLSPRKDDDVLVGVAQEDPSLQNPSPPAAAGAAESAAPAADVALQKAATALVLPTLRTLCMVPKTGTSSVGGGEDVRRRQPPLPSPSEKGKSKRPTKSLRNKAKVLAVKVSRERLRVGGGAPRSCDGEIPSRLTLKPRKGESTAGFHVPATEARPSVLKPASREKKQGDVIAPTLQRKSEGGRSSPQGTERGHSSSAQDSELPGQFPKAADDITSPLVAPGENNSPPLNASATGTATNGTRSPAGTVLRGCHSTPGRQLDSDKATEISVGAEDYSTRLSPKALAQRELECQASRAYVPQPAREGLVAELTVSGLVELGCPTTEALSGSGSGIPKSSQGTGRGSPEDEAPSPCPAVSGSIMTKQPEAKQPGPAVDIPLPQGTICHGGKSPKDCSQRTTGRTTRLPQLDVSTGKGHSSYRMTFETSWNIRERPAAPAPLMSNDDGDESIEDFIRKLDKAKRVHLETIEELDEGLD